MGKHKDIIEKVQDIIKLLVKKRDPTEKLKGCCWTCKDTGFLGLQRRGIQSGARDEA